MRLAFIAPHSFLAACAAPADTILAWQKCAEGMIFQLRIK
jgi:hypothetical protein